MSDPGRFPILIAVAVLLWAVQAYALDCSHKPPCPPGTIPQESVTCDACCPDGSYIRNATDQYCCPSDHFLSPDGTRCLPDGAVLKSDGSCWVMAEADPCCREGWHAVGAYDCCPDGLTLAADNDNCCTSREDGTCCAPGFRHHPLTGNCLPPRPAGVMIR